jgi:GH15 family glucan-1,4-alpha-glucosidase
MPRDLPIGNGSLFLCFDEHYQIREITYPYAGAENHTVGHPCRFGFYVDGQMSWINSRDWNLRLLYRKDSLITNVRGSSELHRLSFESDDGIDFYESLWVRDLRITNDGGVLREIRPFFSFDFHINGTEVGDTAAFNPVLKTLTHYKKNIYFTFNLLHPVDGPGILQYATGRKELPGAEGTWKDAEDGVLSGNPIAQGSVDSTFGCSLFLPPGETLQLFVWMVVGDSWDDAERMTRHVIERHPSSFLERTHNYWKFWVDQDCFHANVENISIPTISTPAETDLAHRLRTTIPAEFQEPYLRTLIPI